MCYMVMREVMGGKDIVVAPSMSPPVAVCETLVGASFEFGPRALVVNLAQSVTHVFSFRRESLELKNVSAERPTQDANPPLWLQLPFAHRV